MKFAEFLYTLRKEKGLTQSELADKLGVTNKAVSKWETGEGYPETSQLVPLAEIFGVTVDELLKGERIIDSETSKGERVEKFVKEESFDESDEHNRKAAMAGKIGELISSLIMISAIIVFFVVGFVFEKWHPGWVVFPLAAISCAIVGAVCSIVKKMHSERGRKINGDISGLIMLTGSWTYCFIGCLFNLWHPGWVIFPVAAMICALFNAIYEFKH